MLSPNSFLQDFCVPNTVNPETNGFELEDSPSSSPSSVATSNGGGSSESTRYSNNILRYISDILMDEEDELMHKPCMLQECLRLQAAEKSFYDVLDHNNHPSSKDSTSTAQDGNFGRTASFESNSGGSCTTDNSYESDWVNLVGEIDSSSLQLQTPLVEQNYYDLIEPDPASHFQDGTWRQLQTPLVEQNYYDLIEPDPASHFQDGTWSWNDIQTVIAVEEASASLVTREKRSHTMDDDDDNCNNEQEGRGSKLSANFSGELEPPEILDEVLLYQTGRYQHQQASKNVGSGGKATARRPRLKKGSTDNTEAVDLWTMLTQCAQAVASYDQRNTNELLKQIRQHSSPFGDGLQRLAYYFADGLEIRLAAETPSYMPINVKQFSA
ncbi:unnamed protein product [Vicia faba]|uniref:Uncharacterized protein n=1 Tax=Vicia faba TaxID=3906 RepID=A0AAV0Z7F7_VICFA|nr:unnamed protein product [Vicia faba]